MNQELRDHAKLYRKILYNPPTTFIMKACFWTNTSKATAHLFGVAEQDATIHMLKSVRRWQVLFKASEVHKNMAKFYEFVIIRKKSPAYSLLHSCG
jgi:hypothetical protein